MAARQAGVGAKNMHGWTSARASTLDARALEFKANGWSSHGWLCSACHGIGIVRLVDDEPRCERCEGVKHDAPRLDESGARGVV
jgi:hypothetical protein